MYDLHITPFTFVAKRNRLSSSPPFLDAVTPRLVGCCCFDDVEPTSNDPCSTSDVVEDVRELANRCCRRRHPLRRIGPEQPARASRASSPCRTRRRKSNAFRIRTPHYNGSLQLPSLPISRLPPIDSCSLSACPSSTPGVLSRDAPVAFRTSLLRPPSSSSRRVFFEATLGVMDSPKDEDDADTALHP
jgi:hypothetical protein